MCVLRPKIFAQTHSDSMRLASLFNNGLCLFAFVPMLEIDSQELYKFIAVFLFFQPRYAIIIYNAVMCWNKPWQYGCNRPNALPSGRAFLYINCKNEYSHRILLLTIGWIGYVTADMLFKKYIVPNRRIEGYYRNCAKLEIAVLFRTCRI